MSINVENFMELVTYLMIAVGVTAFLVSMITQVIKELPGIKNIQTNVVVLVVALILCPVEVILACQYFGMEITWYYVFAALIAAFIVYLVSTGGWEKVSEIWNRTKYKNNRGQ